MTAVPQLAVAYGKAMTAFELVTFAGVFDGSLPDDADEAGHAENCRESLFDTACAALPVDVNVVPE